MRGDKNGRVGQEEGSVVVNPAINTREDACIALCKYLFSPTLVPQSCFYFIHVTKSLLFILACPSGSERLCFKNLMTLLYDFISEKYKAFVVFLHESALVYVVKHVIFIPFPCSAHTVCSVQHNSKNISQYLNSSLPDSYVIITLGLWFYRPADCLLPRDWLRVLKVRSVGPIGLNSVSNLVLWLACGE